MELSSDFINIQGILLSLEKSLGDFRKIKYKGGNEEKIAKTVTEIRKVLTSKKYLEEGFVNNIYGKELENVVLFLILNTDINSPLDKEQYSHLTNITPQLSKCLLINVVVELKLSSYFCAALEEFSLDVIQELLSEMGPSLKKSRPKDHLEHASSCLNLMINKLSAVEYSKKVEEAAEKLTDLAAVMLRDLTGLHGDQPQTCKISHIYEHMGCSMLKVFELLLKCDVTNLLLVRIIEKLTQTCCSIVMAVTIDVYCFWAEVDVEGQNLQSLVSGNAYLFIEKYHKYKPAKELIQMLGAIARKPKTIDELIHQSDVSTMISMVDKADANQKHWFMALLNTRALENKETIKCISRWSHLCTDEDVSRLLNLSSSCRDEQAKKLVVRCASHLSLEQLAIISVRHFHQNGVDKSLGDVQDQLVLLFNKLRDSTRVQEEFAKDLHLLLLQDPRKVLAYVFAECLKNTFYTYKLREVFPTMKEVAKVKHIGMNVLVEEIGNHKPDGQNCKNHVELLTTLIDVDFYNVAEVTVKIILPFLHTALSGRDYKVLKHQLEVLNGLLDIRIREETECLLVTLFNIMRSCRCKFMEFDRLKQEIVKEVVEIIDKCCESGPIPSIERIKLDDEDSYVLFYRIKLSRDTNYRLLQHFCPELDYSKEAELICHLSRILPLCVKREWLNICSGFCDDLGASTAMALLTYFMLILSHWIAQQEPTEEVERMTNAYKYCLQNFGIVVKELIQTKVDNLDEDIAVTKRLCHVLKELPARVLSEEGLPLAQLMSEQSLEKLRDDDKFISFVTSTEAPEIRQMWAKKIGIDAFH